MKKLKLNSVIASVLSLGIICSGSVFASGDEDDSKLPRLPKSYETSKSHKTIKNSQEDEESNETVKSFELRKTERYWRRKFIRFNRYNFYCSLDDIKNTDLYKDFPKTIEELADIAFNEEGGAGFLERLYDEKEKLDEKELDIGIALDEIILMLEFRDEY